MFGPAQSRGFQEGDSMSDQPTATGSLEPLPTRALMSLPTVKLIVIALLIGGLMIPLLLVYDLTQERESRYREAVQEIGGAWGGPQTLAGPVVAVPFVPATPPRDGPVRYDVFILPETLDVAASLRPEIRYRGPFESVVYTVELRATGRFVPPAADSLRLPAGELVWRDARILLGLGDARSLQPGAAITWDGRDLPLEPSAQTIGFPAGAALRARPLAALSDRPQDFAFTLRLNGSSSMAIQPMARDVRVRLSGAWHAPGFFGAFLPAERTITDQGFDARWVVAHFGRGYGQSWTTVDNPGDGAFARARFGVDFIQPVTPARQAERAVKYGVLFLVMTFALYFLFEVVSGLRVHIVQYGLVGLSMCLFYLLLLSLGEQIGFPLAYVISAAAIVAQSGLYSLAVLRSRRHAAVFSALLVMLYGFLYVVLGLESWALLVGSIALFLALSAVMFATRNVDWHAAGRAASPAAQPQ
jgi:inner membrane protein